MVQNDGTKPWLWVHKSDNTPETKGDEEAVKEASALLSQITERVQEIQDDASIPIRSNKKKGLKSKKEMREEVQQGASEKLKDIATKHGYVVGKWLIFAQPDRVDALWNSVATSLVSGPLSSTSAYRAKVATSPQNDTPNYSHLVCVYVPDVYDQPSVTEALKEEYFAELNAAKTAAAEETAAKKAAAGETKKPKPKLKQKGGDDPFASDDEDGEENAEPEVSAPAAVKGKKPAPKKKAGAEAFASDEDAKDPSPKAKAPPKKRAAKRSKDADEDGSENEAPKKKRGRT
ncbi:hypothetical protein TRAPUB_7590 [Trametes pubescens]|uniref:Uncharacterized protein n=1 Tax=Trametes pubescens TaxID=154538 RepID=A0A1M2V332_TRAPU|nr:hypothetical protein TRAPUB_7590 [Trametes pubescens]